MKKTLLTFLALIVVAGIAKTVFASYDTLPEPMVGQSMAHQNGVDYYGGFTGNQSVYNHTNDTANPSGPTGQSVTDSKPLADADKRTMVLGIHSDWESTVSLNTSTGTVVAVSDPFGEVDGRYANGAAWNGSMWVVAGGSDGTNTVATSDNGINWTVRGNPFGGTAANAIGYGVAWNPKDKMWVAVGKGANSIAYSRDGVSWTGVTAHDIFSVNGNKVAWNGSKWVAVGYDTTAGRLNSMAYSTDGITWTRQTPTTSGGYIFPLGGYGVAWNGTVWVAVGGGSSLSSIATSADGITWAGVAGSRTLLSTGYGVAWNSTNKVWVAVGDLGIIKSTNINGLSWTAVTTGTSNGYSMCKGNDVAWNGTQWVVVGGEPDPGDCVLIVYASSTDGVSWPVVYSEDFQYKGVATNSGTLVDGSGPVTDSKELFGFEKNSLISPGAGCIQDIVFKELTNRCFFSNSRNGNIKVVSSRTYVNGGVYIRPVLETAALFYPPAATIVGDAYLNGLDSTNFAFWGRNLTQSNGAANSDSFWGVGNYINNPAAQASLPNSLATESAEFKQYKARIDELKGEAAPLNATDLIGNIYLQSDVINQPPASGIKEKYPNGKTWHVTGDVTINSDIVFHGVGTIIFDGTVTLNAGKTISTTAAVADLDSKLGIIALGSFSFNGNNKIQASIFNLDYNYSNNVSIDFAGDNVDLVGSFVSRYINISGRNNIRFYYDKRLDSGWPPGFRYLNMPHPTEN